ncbi:hypothetical protein NC652_010418 [Populus alba x Populus x berolinensis]|nr:hypothetical protein NC652_010418 [Populus alba x Populus x berolinensis]
MAIGQIPATKEKKRVGLGVLFFFFAFH